MGSGSSIYIGLMSGTSLDGVDVAIVDFCSLKPAVLYCHTEPYPNELKSRIQDLTCADSITIESLGQLDIEIAEFYVRTVRQALTDAEISPDQVRAIGSHGQTIYHSPHLWRPHFISTYFARKTKTASSLISAALRI